MKLNEADIKLFQALNGSEVGKYLIDYLERLATHICDSRTWSENENREFANKVSKIIDDNLTTKIKMNSPQKIVNPNHFE